MRKLIFAVFIAAIAIGGLTTAASAATTGSHSSHGFCDFNPKPKTCVPTNPGTPNQCTATSIHCVGDSIFTRSDTQGNWNRDRSRGPQDPCIFHEHKGFGDNSRSSTDFRGCRCETVKIWHTKIVCHKEVWYFTTEVICRGHHRDPHQCGCQSGGQVQPVIGNKVA